MRQIRAIVIGQYDIGKQQLQMVRMAAEGEVGFGGISRFEYTIPSQAQDLTGYLTNESFILHEQDGCGLPRDVEWSEQYGAGCRDFAFSSGLTQPSLTQPSLAQSSLTHPSLVRISLTQRLTSNVPMGIVHFYFHLRFIAYERKSRDWRRVTRAPGSWQDSAWSERISFRDRPVRLWERWTLSWAETT